MVFYGWDNYHDSDGRDRDKEGFGMIKSFISGFKDFSNNLVVIVNTVLLSVVYLAVGATSIAAKILRKSFLKSATSGDTYWCNLDLKEKPIDDYYKQF